MVISGIERQEHAKCVSPVKAGQACAMKTKQKKQEPFCKSKKNAPEFWRKEQWHK